ncbi:M48 family metalloprotease [Hymenobacter sp. BT664]|uniref:M48 family metalloprotease n=1 Tax=Hymenobacter montanus TaxID=2771359 RepID=A0A927BDT3_9BACT|nr:M48 family metalloprotease [Hymenobacter montanus]MBD2768980.1 M48 family metalloprotease [Hymenobacter montanus]
MRLNLRFIIALIVAAVSLFGYYFNTSKNEVTGETQHVNMSADQEIALGLQAAPAMAAQYGGESPDARAAAAVREVGQKIIASTKAGQTPYKFQFHLLADDQTINAFALPGGQVFITQGLLKKLTSEAQLAGVLAHEVGHVVGRHSAAQVAKANLTQGLAGAATIASYDPDSPGRSAAKAAVAAAIAKVIGLRFGREDELEADKLAVDFTPQAGYDPRTMIQVMQMLAQQGGRSATPEFLSTHPDPGNRISYLQQEIAAQFPQGVPAGLRK